MPILLDDLNLRKAELLLCQNALARASSIIEAARLLGITRHALKRRMIKHGLEVPKAFVDTPADTPLPRHRPPTSPERMAPRSVPSEGT